MAVLHHHRVVPGQSVGDAVLAFTVHNLEHKEQLVGEDGAHNGTGHLVMQDTRDVEWHQMLART